VKSGLNKKDITGNTVYTNTNIKMYHRRQRWESENTSIGELL
jgi:hypothetical protein